MDVWKTEMEKEYSAIGVGKGKTIISVPHQTGRTTKRIDEPRIALTPGKRVSKYGKIYYEYRKNRSDLPGKKV